MISLEENTRLGLSNMLQEGLEETSSGLTCIQARPCTALKVQQHRKQHREPDWHSTVSRFVPGSSCYPL